MQKKGGVFQKHNVDLKKIALICNTYVNFKGEGYYVEFMNPN